jgi:hypothetical protein
MINKFFSSLLALALSSCIPTAQILTNNRQVVTLQKKNASNNSIFNSLFELESVVSIQTSNDFLLSEIAKTIYMDNKIILLDRNYPHIYVIDANTGKMLTQINRVGKGPGESNKIMDITYDSDSEIILALNDYKKLLSFTLHGDFTGEEKVEHLYEDIVYNDGFVLFYNQCDNNNFYSQSLAIYDIKNKVWDKTGNEETTDFAIRNYGRNMVKSKNIWFSAPGVYNLFKVVGNEIELDYSLELGNTAITENIRKNYSMNNIFAFLDDVKKKGIIYNISSVRETEHYIVFKSNLPGLLFFNKNTLDLKWDNVFDEQLGIHLLNYFPHDGDDNRIMFIVQPNEWLKRQPNSNIPEAIRKKIDSFAIEEDSNPILVFYKEKLSNAE